MSGKDSSHKSTLPGTETGTYGEPPMGAPTDTATAASQAVSTSPISGGLHRMYVSALEPKTMQNQRVSFDFNVTNTHAYIEQIKKTLETIRKAGTKDKEWLDKQSTELKSIQSDLGSKIRRNMDQSYPSDTFHNVHERALKLKTVIDSRNSE